MADSMKDLFEYLNKCDMSNEGKVTEWCAKLCDFYDNNERHSYAEITEYLLGTPGGIEYSYKFVDTLTEMNDRFDEDGIKKNINKLIDHIKLEQVRYRYLSNLIDETVKAQYLALNNAQIEGVAQVLTQSQELASVAENMAKTAKDKVNEAEEQNRKISSDITEVKEGMKNISVLAKKAEKKVKSAQTENIAILGIFASIVFAFSGVMTFSSSVLENMDKPSAYRVMLVTLLIGFVLFNVIALLVIYMKKIVYGQWILENENKAGSFIRENAFWMVINTIILILTGTVVFMWNHSSEKAVLDESNTYKRAVYQRDYEEMIDSTSGNIISE